MTAYEKAKRWYEKETAIATGKSQGLNEFAPYAPFEAREFFAKSIKSGKIPIFTDEHFHLWAAIAEILDTETFTESLGWNVNDVKAHMLGNVQKNRVPKRRLNENDIHNSSKHGYNAR